MRNKLLYIAAGLVAGAIIFIGSSASAQVSGSLWKISANVLYPINSIWDVADPNQAAASGTNCLQITTTGLIEKTGSACGSGAGTVTQINTTFPIVGGPITTTGTLTFGGISTSTNPTIGDLPFWTGVNKLGDVATTSVTCSGNTSCTTFTAIGGSPITISSSVGSSGLATSSPLANSNLLVYSTGGAGSAYGVGTSTLSASSPLTGSFTQIGSGGSLGCQTASGSQAGCLSSADWNTFNGKQATISATWPITLTGAAVGFNGLSTSTAAVIGNIPYFSGVNTFANEATGTISNGTNISVTNGGTASVLGSNITINLSGQVAYANGGTGTTTAPISQLLYGGASSYQSVATSSASCSGSVSCSAFTVVGSVSPTITSSALTSAITALGPVNQTQTGATQTLATSTNTTNGLTSALQIIGSGNTQTFTPSLSGVLTEAGGGTHQGSYTTGDTLYASNTNTLSKLGIGTAGQVLGVVGGVPAWVATSTGGGGTVTQVSTDSTLTGGPITTTGTLGINLTHANTWTGLQQFNANASTTALTDTGNAYFPLSVSVSQNGVVIGTTTTPLYSTGGVALYPPSLTVEGNVDRLGNWTNLTTATDFNPTLLAQSLGQTGASIGDTAAILGYASTTASAYGAITASIAGVNDGPETSSGTGNLIGAAIYADQTHAFSPTKLAYSVYAIGGANYFQDNVGVASATPTYLLSLNTGATGVSIDSSGNLRLNSLSTGCLTNTNGLVSSTGTACGTGSGTVTSVTLATPNSTLSLGGTNPVTTSGTINADLNLAHSNAWTAVETHSAPLGIGSTTPFFALSVGTGASAFYISTSTGEVVGYDTVSGYVGQITPLRYLAFTLSTSTAWTGTSTNASFYGDTNSVVMPFTGTIKNMNCFTNAGTMNVEASTTAGVNAIYQAASSTPALLNFSVAVVKNQAIYFTAGTPASSPTSVSCTLGAIQTP